MFLNFFLFSDVKYSQNSSKFLFQFFKSKINKISAKYKSFSENKNFSTKFSPSSVSLELSSDPVPAPDEPVPDSSEIINLVK